MASAAYPRVSIHRERSRAKLRVEILVAAVLAIVVFMGGMAIGRTTTDTQTVKSSTSTKTIRTLTPPVCMQAVNGATDVVAWSNSVASLALKGMRIVSTDGIGAAASVFDKLDSMGTIGAKKMDDYATTAALCLSAGKS